METMKALILCILLIGAGGAIQPAHAAGPSWITEIDSGITSTSISEDGSLIAATSNHVHVFDGDGTLLWDEWSGQSTDITADSRFLCLVSGPAIRLFDREGNKIWAHEEIGGIGALTSARITSDGSSFVAFSKELGRIYFFNQARGLQWNRSVGQLIYDASLSDDGYVVASYVQVLPDEAKVSLYNASNRVLWTRTVDSKVSTITKDGKYIAVGRDYVHYGGVRLYNRDGRQLWDHPTDGWVRTLAVTSDGSFIAAGDWQAGSSKRGGKIYFFNRDGDLLWSKQVEDFVVTLDMSADGSYVVAGTKNVIYILKENGETLLKFTASKAISSVAMAGDGSGCIAGTEGGSLYFFSTTLSVEGSETYDADATDALTWNYRIPVLLKENKSVERLDETVVLHFSDLFGQNFDYPKMNMRSIRVIDKTALPDESNEYGGNDVPYLIEDIDGNGQPSGPDILAFLADVPANAQKTYYVYYSEDMRIPAKSYTPFLYNLLPNPGFEERSDDNMLEGWKVLGSGYGIASDVFHTGNSSMRLQSLGNTSSRGAVYRVYGSPDNRIETLRLSGWSRAQGVNGTKGRAYSVYADVQYMSNRSLFGQRASFDLGTHDWQYAEVTITPTESIKLISVYVLFEQPSGTSWFDDMALYRDHLQVKVASREAIKGFLPFKPPVSHHTTSAPAPDGQTPPNQTPRPTEAREPVASLLCISLLALILWLRRVQR